MKSVLFLSKAHDLKSPGSSKITNSWLNVSQLTKGILQKSNFHVLREKPQKVTTG